MSARTSLYISVALLFAAAASLPLDQACAQDADNPACSPVVFEALEQAGQRGVTEAAAIIRNPVSGIRQPDSIFDFSCIEDLFQFPDINILFDPNRIINGILRAVQDKVCEVAELKYAEHIGRPLDDLIFSRDIPRLPGLDVRIRKTKTPEFPSAETRPLERPNANKGRASDANIFRRALE